MAHSFYTLNSLQESCQEGLQDSLQNSGTLNKQNETVKESGLQNPRWNKSAAILAQELGMTVKEIRTVNIYGFSDRWKEYGASGYKVPENEKRPHKINML